jgi:hypothetical protein
MADRARKTIVAVTTEDDAHRDVRHVAMERARREEATLILYDLTAGENPLESPLPTQWSAEGTEDDVGDRLAPDELEAAGRATIARQVQDARNQGIDAWGWLPASDDRTTLLKYAVALPSAVVLVPPGDLAVDEPAPVQVDVVGAPA